MVDESRCEKIRKGGGERERKKDRLREEGDSVQSNYENYA